MCIKIKFVSYILSVFAISVCMLFAGCSSIFSGKSRYTYTVPQEKLQQIETFELTEAEDIEPEKTPGEDRYEKGPAEVTLSLEECRALTIENNLDLKIQLIEPAVAADRVIEQEERFEAIFTATGKYTKNNSPNAGYLDEISGNKVDESNVKSGLRLPLQSGGTINFNLTDVWRKTDAPSKYNPSYTPSFTASISHDLLRNAGKRATTYYVQMADYNRQIIDSGTKQAAIYIIKNIEGAYWRLYEARRLLDVRKQEYELAKELFEEAERFVEVGEKTEIELLRTRVGMASSYEQIIIAKNAVRDWERYFKRMLNKPGLGMKTGTAVIPSTEPDPVHYEFNKKEIVTRAIENRMDMLQAELSLAWDDTTIEYRRNQLHPILNLQYRYGINSLGASRDDAYDLLLENEYKDHIAILYALVPLGNKAAQSSLKQAAYEKTKSLSSLESKKAMIEYEVLRAIDKLEASWQKILASRETTLSMDRQYKAEKREYELGMLTSNDVLSAQTELANAQIMEIFALTQYQIDLIDLAYSTGTLLGASKVDLGPIVPKK